MCYLMSFLSAFLFALGLGLSGMTDPENVIGFLNIFGDWKPALILVMGGAIAFHASTYYLITKRSSPLFDKRFVLPTKKHIDTKLIVGSIIFGSGWGIGGYCPGPALVSLVTMRTEALIFVFSMFIGIIFFHYVFKPLLK